MNTLKYTILLVTVLTALTGCGPSVPSNDKVTANPDSPTISPDYTSVTIPPNIAPLNFEIMEECDESMATIGDDSGHMIKARGPIVKWNEKEWRKLAESNKGKTLSGAVYLRHGKEWTRKDFKVDVAEEPIDRYFSYRLIEPSFVYFNQVALNQRDLTSWDVETIHNNNYVPDESSMSCMNCHVPRNNNADNHSQFHVRNTNGGTVIIVGSHAKKVKLTTDSVPSAGVYPAWHPTEELIAYSMNGTKQYFYTRDPQKVEVLDQWSDLILYDSENETVKRITATPDVLETFPAWNPEGNRLYFSAARVPESAPEDSLQKAYDSVRYDILSLPFDMETKRFTKTEPDTVLCVSRDGKSASLPRISPDGRYMLTCVGDYGTFHIWHKSSDLWLTDLATGETRPLDAANSRDVDSYHSWSSNSRWVIFSSRRDDHGFTRPYIAYIDKDGNPSKAFIVPQENPRYYKELFKSYNVPEFMVNPVETDRATILDAVESTPIQVADRKD